jgi:hypothetical protein
MATDAYRLDMLDDDDAWTEPSPSVAPDAWEEPSPPVGRSSPDGSALPSIGPERRWYSVEEAASILGLSTPTIRRRIKQGGPPFRLPDASAWPVLAERVTRPQGSVFYVQLPSSLEARAPSVEDGSTEDPPAPVDVMTIPDASATPVRADEDASIAPIPASSPLGDASVAAFERLALALAAKGELVGELRARLDGTARDLDASRADLGRVTAALARVNEELEAARSSRDATLHAERERRLVAEAALLALTTAPSSRPWWRRLFRWA